VLAAGYGTPQDQSGGYSPAAATWRARQYCGTTFRHGEGGSLRMELVDELFPEMENLCSYGFQ